MIIRFAIGMYVPADLKCSGVIKTQSRIKAELGEPPAYLASTCTVTYASQNVSTTNKSRHMNEINPTSPPLRSSSLL